MFIFDHFKMKTITVRNLIDIQMKNGCIGPLTSQNAAIIQIQTETLDFDMKHSWHVLEGYLNDYCHLKYVLLSMCCFLDHLFTF
jgi:hypothetical protein